uniref:Uncharacterized protein n=1 Tax=Anguilla anguilla TaxID=7936 RepID=A0A0E9XXT1_ANGAN
MFGDAMCTHTPVHWTQPIVQLKILLYKFMMVACCAEATTLITLKCELQNRLDT